MGIAAFVLGFAQPLTGGLQVKQAAVGTIPVFRDGLFPLNRVECASLAYNVRVSASPKKRSAPGCYPARCFVTLLRRRRLVMMMMVMVVRVLRRRGGRARRVLVVSLFPPSLGVRVMGVHGVGSLDGRVDDYLARLLEDQRHLQPPADLNMLLELGHRT